jgi:hypothetical protein
MAGAYVQHVAPFSTVMVALPPPNQRGVVDYGRVFVSLATDFGPASVRIAIGRQNDFPVVRELNVPTGRQVVFEARTEDEVVSVVHRSGPPVSVLVEYQSRPDF